MEKKIKFQGSDALHQQFTSAVRKNINEYFRENKISVKGNFPLVMRTIVILTFYLAPIVLLLTIQFNIWIALILTITAGIGLAGVGMGVMHDAIHGSYSSKNWVNKMFGSTMYLLGNNVVNWKIQHNYLHHTYTNIEGFDRDITSRGPLRFSEHAPLHKVHNYQFIYAFFLYGFMSLSRLFGDLPQLLKYNRSGLTRKYNYNPTGEIVKVIALKLIYFFTLIALPMMITTFAWWQVLIGFLIMQWIAGFILTIIFQMAHIVEGTTQPLPVSGGVIHSDWMVHELLTTANFAPNNLFLGWYAGGLNFQIEHHLFPNICHIHYRKIAPIVEETAKQFGIPYNLKPTFFQALGSHVRRLKELGIQPV